jgi:ferric-dicitrate binding protein FerR (iron transport regulator)
MAFWPPPPSPSPGSFRIRSRGQLPAWRPPGCLELVRGASGGACPALAESRLGVNVARRAHRLQQCARIRGLLGGEPCREGKLRNKHEPTVKVQRNNRPRRGGSRGGTLIALSAAIVSKLAPAVAFCRRPSATEQLDAGERRQISDGGNILLGNR